MIYHIQKDSWSLDDQNPQKIMDFYNFSLAGEASNPFGISDKVYFFRQIEIILWSEKRNTPRTPRGK